MKYNKILIIGTIGAGKTTFARKLSKLLKIKNYELDNIVYKRRDVHEQYPPKVRDKKLKSILKRKKWVLEGFHNHSWTYPIYKKADIIIILDVKLSTAKSRVVRRFLKRRILFKKNTNKKVKTTIKLLEYINNNPKKYLKIQKQLAKKFNKKYIILNNKEEIKEFIKKLK